MSNPDPGSTPSKLSIRNSELDFLRGCAVFLVLFAHHSLMVHHSLGHFNKNIGWVGVDLFFVLSGFLVSGLLFAEYKKIGYIRPFSFLTRRGFKIYPLFYFSLLVTFIIYLVDMPPHLNYKGMVIDFLPEVFFLQNYLNNIWGHHWTLAIEEHFYILVSVLIYFLTKHNLMKNHKVLVLLATLIFAGCLLLRFVQNYLYPENSNLTHTHLRVDSLFMGVFIGYFYHFYPSQLSNFYERFKYLLLVLFIIPFLFIIPNSFVHHFNPDTWLFLKTVGLTLVYISFGSLLIIFLLSRTVRDKLQIIVTPFFYRIICLVGVYSYSIYLFHLYILRYFVKSEYVLFEEPPGFDFQVILSLMSYVLASILLGIVTSYLIEKPFLKIRDKYFPRKA